MKNKSCPKCNGLMFLNEDKDLHCFMCGKTIVLTVRRSYDERTGDLRYNKVEERGEHMGADFGENIRRLWDKSSQDNDSTLARQVTNLGTGLFGITRYRRYL